MRFLSKKTGNVIHIYDKHISIIKELIRSDEYTYVNDDFKESEHPRDNDGKFATGSGGGSSSTETKKETKSELPPHLQELVKKINGGYKSGETTVTEVNIPGYSPSEPDKPEHHDIEPYEKTTAKDKTVSITLPNGKEIVATKGHVDGLLKSAKTLKNGGYIDHVGFEHSPNLSESDRKIENDFYTEILKNTPKLVADYKSRFGNKIDPDEVKKLDPNFDKDPSLAAAVHEPSSYLSKVIWKNALKDKKEAGDDSPVIFTAGGSGSGKSEAMKLAKIIIGAKNDALTFDSVLGNFDKSVAKIQEALDGQTGKVDIAYTNAPMELAVMLNMQRGRTVKLDTQIDAHFQASENIRKLQEHFKGSDRVNIVILNNKGNPPDLAEGTINDVPSYADKAQVKEKMVAYAENLVKTNQIVGKDGKPIPNAEEKLKMLLGK